MDNTPIQPTSSLVAPWRLHITLPSGSADANIPGQLHDLAAILVHAQRAYNTHDGTPFRHSRILLRVPVHDPHWWSHEKPLRIVRSILRCSWGVEWDLHFSTSATPHPISYGRVAPSAAPDRRDEDHRVYALRPDLDSISGLTHQFMHTGKATVITLDAPGEQSASSLAVRRLLDLALARAAGLSWVTVTLTQSDYKRPSPSKHPPTWHLLHLVAGAIVAHGYGIDRISRFQNAVTPSWHQADHVAHRAPDVKTLRWLEELISCIIKREFLFQNPNRDKTPTELVEALPPQLSTSEVQELLDSIEATCSREQALVMQLAGLPRTLDTSSVAPKVPRIVFEPLEDELLDRLLDVVRARPSNQEDRANSGDDLQNRHANQLHSSLDRLVATCANQLVSGLLSPSCLLVRAVTPFASAVDAPTDARPRFRCVGDRWEILFSRGTPLHLNQFKGFQYIRLLLSRPHEVVSAVELLAASSGQEAVPLGSRGLLLDHQAISEYRARHRDIQSELTAANDNQDLGNIERLQHELDALEGELRRAVDRYGQPREATDRARARKSVSNAIRRALDHIGENDRDLTEHLRASLRLGHRLCYAPSNDIEWIT